ncbi:sulfotransferase domain-containing protein [Acidocella sp.]|uniref:sulfotransferase domain-containing protein n=1 Tax=Acidocella sp. TaxID=50710 RepID=UPI003CFED36A
MSGVVDKTDMEKLAFLICGVQKGGTTALWSFLRRHPTIGFGPRKEMHFFDDETLPWENPPYDDLHREYEGFARGILRGDATPIYTYWPPCIARIHAYNPAVKLIISLRDPVERAYSNWRMEMSREGDSLPFGEAIRGGRERLLAQAETAHIRRIFGYVERGFYAEQLDRVFDFFPREQVLLLRQTDLKTRHGETLNQICDFLRIARFETPPKHEIVFSHENTPRAPMAPEDARYLRNLYTEDALKLRDKYGITF